MSQKYAKLLMGLPLAGKTMWIQKQNFKGYFRVSADDIKEKHPDYDPENSYLLHQHSVEEAERLMNEYSARGLNIIMDGGSVNRSYTLRIINMLQGKGYEVELIHIKTPLLVCLERNQERTRKVPEHAIVEKAMKETAQFYKLIEVVNKYRVVDYFTHEHIFIDMDGVIASQITLPVINGEIDFVNGEIHKHQQPVKQVIDKFKKLAKAGKTLYILSAIPNSISYKEKMEWLAKNFPIIPEDRIFFANRGIHKAEMLENLAYKFKLKKHQITMVDDMHDTLGKVLLRNMRPMHISEFLTYEFN